MVVVVILFLFVNLVSLVLLASLDLGHPLVFSVVLLC